MTTILGVTLVLAALYFGSTWGKEYYRVKMGQTCTERMFLIEEAKKKYRAQSSGNPSRYSDLLPFLPFTGFPMCPWGGKYEHELDLDHPVTCTLNGDKNYEPATPGINPKRNGYMDLAVKRKTVTLFDYFYNKANWKGTDKDPLADDPKSKKSLFND